jgi:hypothetical protein
MFLTFLPEFSGFLPKPLNSAEFLPEFSGFLPEFSGFLPKFSGFLPAFSGSRVAHEWLTSGSRPVRVAHEWLTSGSRVAHEAFCQIQWLSARIQWLTSGSRVAHEWLTRLSALSAECSPLGGVGLESRVTGIRPGRSSFRRSGPLAGMRSSWLQLQLAPLASLQLACAPAGSSSSAGRAQAPLWLMAKLQLALDDIDIC